MKGTLEHVNVSVVNPERTADLLTRLFGWHIRWQGPSALGGRTVHVGSEDHYVALYTPVEEGDGPPPAGGLNHIGVVVADLDAAERRVRAAGLATFNHADYEPGRRFYFNDPDGTEFEVVSYA